MRSVLRGTLLILVLLALLAPLTSFASGGPCPDDLEAAKNCAPDTPPFYVVANRTFDRLGPQYGTGCQPWILKNPDCKDCTDGSAACELAAADVEMTICGYEMPNAGAQEGDLLYEMCCDCGDNSKGVWMYRERYLSYDKERQAWECPEYGRWTEGLPPDTGINLPAPFIVGGLAIAGVALVGTGLVVRRRTAKMV
jgi:hypothetical protein